MIVLHALLLAVVVSIDTLASGFAYGTSNTKVPLRNLIVIDIICSVLLGVGLFCGLYISNYISPLATRIISATTLITIGCYKLVRKSAKEAPKSALGWVETIILAVILSIDGMAVGIGASIHNTSVAFCLIAIAFSLVTDFVFFIFGHKIGQKATQKTRLDLAWLSGVVLIILGLIRLF